MAHSTRKNLRKSGYKGRETRNQRRKKMYAEQAKEAARKSGSSGPASIHTTYESRWGHSRTRRVKGHPHIQARKELAEARKKERDARSPQEQLKLIQSRPGASAREVQRLQAMISQ